MNKQWRENFRKCFPLELGKPMDRDQMQSVQKIINTEITEYEPMRDSPLNDAERAIFQYAYFLGLSNQPVVEAQ